MKSSSVCLCLLLVISVVANDYYDTSEKIREKRTLGFILQTFADAIGYDVQKRPSILPITPPPVPAPKVPPAPVPKAPPAPVPKAPAAPVPKAPPRPAPKAPPAPGPKAVPAPVPKVPVTPPKVPPAPTPKGPPTPNPVSKSPPKVTAPPLLTETIQKMFNINFNWNKNVQTTVAPAPLPVPAPKTPPAPIPKLPLPAPKSPPPGPKTPPISKGNPPKYHLYPSHSPDNQNSIQEINEDYNDQQYNNPEENQNLQNNYDYLEPVQVFWQNSPWIRNNQQKQEQPEYQEIKGPNGEHEYHVRHYHQNAHLEQKENNEEPAEEEQNDAQEEQQNYREEPQNYREEEEPQNYHAEGEQQNHQAEEPEDYRGQGEPQNYRKDLQNYSENPQNYRGQEESQNYHQNPQNYRGQIKYREDPENYRENAQIYRGQQNKYRGQQDYREQQQPQSAEDENMESSKSFYQVDNQPRGFQDSTYYQASLPLSVHGIHEDKVLVAWPSPFELAGSEIKTKKVKSQDRLASASENQDYVYQPDSYGQYSFYEVPEPTKEQHDSYESPSEPKIEEELSKNAKLTENNSGKRVTNVHFDRYTLHH